MKVKSEAYTSENDKNLKLDRTRITIDVPTSQSGMLCEKLKEVPEDKIYQFYKDRRIFIIYSQEESDFKLKAIENYVETLIYKGHHVSVSAGYDTDKKLAETRKRILRADEIQVYYKQNDEEVMFLIGFAHALFRPITIIEAEGDKMTPLIKKLMSRRWIGDKATPKAQRAYSNFMVSGSCDRIKKRQE